MESKVQSVIMDLGLKELNHPNLPGGSLGIGFVCLFMVSNFFHPANFIHGQLKELSWLHKV